MRVAWMALLIAACSPAEEPEPVDPLAAVRRVRATIQEAGRLDTAGQDEDARAAWRRAHVEFNDKVEPGLHDRWSDVQVTEVELRFGLVRAAIERRRGGSRGEVRDLVAYLDTAEEALVPPPEPQPEEEDPSAVP